MFFVKPKKFLGFGRHKPIVEFSIAQIHPRPQAHPPLTVEFCCRVAKHVGQINRSLLHAANSNPRGENAESAPGRPIARFCGRFSCFAHAPPGRVAAGMLQRRALFPRCAARGGGGCAAGRSPAGVLQRRSEAVRRAARGGGGCAAERGSAGGLQRRVLFPLYAARGAALSRGPRGAAAAFLASLMRR